MEDDDDHEYEVNFDLGIEEDMGGQPYILGSALGSGLGPNTLSEGREVNEDRLRMLEFSFAQCFWI